MSVNNEMDKEQNDFERKKSERFNEELRFAGLYELKRRIVVPGLQLYTIQLEGF
jgi:hypothetical protein